MEQFEAYFQRADTDRDGRISGNEAVAFFQATLLPQQVLAQIWTYADQKRTGFLGRPEFYNALKLVTVAQSKRELTPDLVKAALYGPASSQIPAPKINIAAAPGPRPNMTPASSPVHLSGTPSSTQGINASGTLGFQAQQNQFARPPRPDPSTPGFQSQLGVSSQGSYGPGPMSVSNRPISSNLPGGNNDGFHAGMSTQVINRSVNSEVTQGGHMGSTNTQTKRPEVSETSSSKLNGTSSLSSQFGKEDSKALSPAVNGITLNSGFGDVFTAKPVPIQNSISPQISADRIPASPATSMSSSRDQPTVRPPAAQSQQFHSTGKSNQPVMPQSSLSSAAPVSTAQSQQPWPRMTQSDIQKYNKVFMQVDTNRDGKITGQEASKLFLSWRLPREILKHVWDLSDQDNDSNLSFREFCIALYLMERYREGRPLPTVLPNSIMFEGTPPPSSGQPVAAHSNASWRPGVVQSQGAKNPRIVPPSGGGRPPRPVPVPLPDEPVQQKAKVPVLEKNLLDQLSSGEQDSLNKKFEEAKDAEKKVADLEKDILEAKQKIQFFHAKMQELILYKSRCDNRLNEITEKVVADKKEAELLAKKYEEKYKQAGDVASKLTIEEATFRDIQEKKMELYRAIVKLEHGNADEIQNQTNQIQTDLEELVRALNERCKTYGLRGKPTSLVELPFGWQPGIAGAAADWDEDWDKFEDEGFTYVKELTLDVKNVIAPPKPKTPLIREKVPSLDINTTAKSPIQDDDNSEVHDDERSNANDVEQTARTPPDSPAGNNMVESPSKELQELRIMKDFDMSSSPRFDMQSEYGGESVLSGDKGFDEPGWGNFDTHYDTDSAWNFDPATPKDGDRESYNDSNSLFGGDDWGLNPIKTGPAGPNSSFQKQGPFFDSVPSTPQYNSTNSPNAVDSFFNRSNTFGFPDSVPATPVYNATSAFADSVPSTPMYNTNSPRRFSEGSEDPYSSFNSFSRFDSFNMNDSGPFGGSSLSRFDSMRSTKDSEFDSQGYFGQQQDSSSSLARFDSFRSTADSDYNFGAFPPRDSFNRFDSMRSTRDSVDYGNSFPSFDDHVDPFGSGEPFRSSNEGHTPKKENDSWKAF